MFEGALPTDPAAVRRWVERGRTGPRGESATKEDRRGGGGGDNWRRGAWPRSWCPPIPPISQRLSGGRDHVGGGVGRDPDSVRLLPRCRGGGPDLGRVVGFQSAGRSPSRDVGCHAPREHQSGQCPHGAHLGGHLHRGQLPSCRGDPAIHQHRGATPTSRSGFGRCIPSSRRRRSLRCPPTNARGGDDDLDSLAPGTTAVWFTCPRRFRPRPRRLQGTSPWSASAPLSTTLFISPKAPTHTSPDQHQGLAGDGIRSTTIPSPVSVGNRAAMATRRRRGEVPRPGCQPDRAGAPVIPHRGAHPPRHRTKAMRISSSSGADARCYIASRGACLRTPSVRPAGPGAPTAPRSRGGPPRVPARLLFFHRYAASHMVSSAAWWRRRSRMAVAHPGSPPTSPRLLTPLVEEARGCPCHNGAVRADGG